ncbi:MAG: hypothetical protein NDJ19_00680 [Ramlibacter sp.]|nr:hypothetical protein [Ramlibacter sp.]
MKVPAVPLLVLGALGVLAVLWLASRASAGTVGQSIGRNVIEGADGAVAGAVVALGDIVGIPETDADQCTLDLARGDLWAASFSCPAPRFVKAVASGDYGARTTGSGAEGGW